MSFLMAALAWAMMALAIQLTIRAPLPGGAVVAVSRTLLAEVWRRGVLPVCGAILFLGLALLPSILEDSSEESSQLHTLLDYGQVWISSVLLLLSMWITSGSLSDEIVTGRMRVLVVHRYGKSALLPGKWLGSLWVILVLLVPATAMLWILCGQVVESSTDLFGEPAVALVSPDSIEVTPEDVENYVALQMLEDPAGWGMLERDQANRIARSRLDRWSRSLVQGTPMEYHFQYRAGLSEGAVLEIRPSLGRLHRSERARIRLHLAGISREVVLRNSVRSQIEIPDELVGETDVVITMEFLGAVSEGIRISSLNWSGSDAVQLRVREGSLLSSLLRSQLLLWIRCGFVAALGLMVSTFLGLPVATLLMLCFFIAAAGGGFTGAFDESHGGGHPDPRDQEPSRILIDLLASGGEWVVSLLGDWSRHVTGSRVAAGENVKVSEVYSGLTTIGLIWVGIALLLGSWMNFRKEHGLGVDR